MDSVPSLRWLCHHVQKALPRSAFLRRTESATSLLAHPHPHPPAAALHLANLSRRTLLLLVVSVVWLLGSGFYLRALVYRRRSYPIAAPLQLPTPPADKVQRPVRLRLHTALSHYRKPSAHRIAVCMVMPNLLQFGGVESWFWSLQHAVFSTPEFYIHAVECTTGWDPELPGKLLARGVQFNIGLFRIQTECHVLLVSGVQPVMRLFPSELQLLVIHGGSQSTITSMYAKHRGHYDDVVGVSTDAANVRNSASSSDGARSVRAHAHFVPSLVEPYHGPCPDVSPPCKRPILFLGRLEEEKNPQLFCDVIAELDPDEHPDVCGWMVGPMYTEADPPRCGRRVTISPPSEVPQCVLRQSWAVLCTSPQEGGPIVFIEAIMNDTPFFMFSTGLGKLMERELPPPVQCILPDPNPGAILRHVLASNFSLLLQQTRQVYERYLTPERITTQWHHLLRAILSNRIVLKLSPKRSVLGQTNSPLELTHQGKMQVLECNGRCLYSAVAHSTFNRSRFVLNYIVRHANAESSAKVRAGFAPEVPYTSLPVRQRLGRFERALPSAGAFHVTLVLHAIHLGVVDLHVQNEG